MSLGGARLDLSLPAQARSRQPCRRSHPLLLDSHLSHMNNSACWRPANPCDGLIRFSCPAPSPVQGQAHLTGPHLQAPCLSACVMAVGVPQPVGQRPRPSRMPPAARSLAEVPAVVPACRAWLADPSLSFQMLQVSTQ